MDSLRDGDLMLEPLTVAHAEAMYPVLAEARLYRYLDYPPPPSLEHVRQVYARLERRVSPEGDEQWLNWVIRPASGQPVGFVQATLVAPDIAWVAYLLASRCWGQGLARRATQAMLRHLVSQHGSRQFLATIEVDNLASAGLLQRLGFTLADAEQAQAHELTATERLYLASADAVTGAARRG